jgi:hypothetical protein
MHSTKSRLWNLFFLPCIILLISVHVSLLPTSIVSPSLPPLLLEFLLFLFLSHFLFPSHSVTEMRILTEPEYQLEAESFLRIVFTNDDPFAEPFHQKIKARRLIFDYHYELESPLADAIIESAISLGDGECYMSDLWRGPGTNINGEKIYSPEHWQMSFKEFEMVHLCKDGFTEFKDFDLGDVFSSEHVIYSTKGEWGVMMSHERFGLLGGSSEFIAKIEELFPELNNQVYGFLDYFRYFKNNYAQATLEWIPPLMSHVCGAERATSLLQEFDLS